ARRVHDAAGLPADEMVNLLGVAAARLARSAPGAAPTSTQADTQPLVPLPAPTGPLADTQPLVPPTAPPGSPADPQPLAPGGAFPLLPGFLRLPLPSYTASGNGIEPGGTQDLDVHQARQGDRTLYVYTLSTRRWVSLSRAQDRLALAAATGRSMDRRGILPGDLVLLRLVVQYPMNRDIVAAQLHDDATATDLDDRLMLKQYIRSGDQYALIPQSTDPSYAARSFAISDPQVSILGDAVLLFSPHPPGLPA
ncbi:MAG: S24 family peptidase, partial [Chloroflexota bacterium]